MSQFPEIKVLFLDFDGVLNSEQEVVMHRRDRKRRWFRQRVRSFLADLLLSATRRLRSSRRRMDTAIVNFAHYYLSNHCDFCPIACSNLQYLLDEIPELRIVISSTWRVYGEAYCKRVLKKNGVDSSRVIGITPYYGHTADGQKSGMSRVRGNQIQAWLNEHRELNVTRFAIVDDDSDMDHLEDFLFQTSTRMGFMFNVAYSALEFLKTGVRPEIGLR